MKDKNKSKGQIFTPSHIVNLILDFVGYVGRTILSKHIIDNSCGDGAFLTEIVRRYISAFTTAGMAMCNLKEELETYVHGIELDEPTYLKCLDNLNKIALENGLNNVNWDIRCADTLKTRDYDGKMDFVVGNPPYVRVHNLADYASAKSLCCYFQVDSCGSQTPKIMYQTYDGQLRMALEELSVEDIQISMSSKLI